MLRSREVAGAVILAAGLAVIIGAFVLFSGGDDGGEPAATERPAFSPANADEAAIAALSARSIDVLRQNQWPSLYEDFTGEFRARCTLEEFVQSGIEAAQEQGANLPLLAFVRLEDIAVQGDAATATIIGEVRGSFEYEVYAAFLKEEGAWKLAPAEGTAGCQAFNRP